MPVNSKSIRQESHEIQETVKRNKKVVKRTWKTKAGVVKTKVYTYNKEVSNIHASGNVSGLGAAFDKRLIVNKKGKISKTVLNKLLAGKSITDQTIIKAKLKQYVDAFTSINEDPSLTVRSLLARVQYSAIETMIINSGYSIQEAAEELSIMLNESISVADLVDENRWHGTTFTSPAGRQAIFVHRYDDSSWVVV